MPRRRPAGGVRHGGGRTGLAAGGPGSQRGGIRGADPVGVDVPLPAQGRGRVHRSAPAGAARRGGGASVPAVRGTRHEQRHRGRGGSGGGHRGGDQDGAGRRGRPSSPKYGMRRPCSTAPPPETRWTTCGPGGGCVRAKQRAAAALAPVLPWCGSWLEHAPYGPRNGAPAVAGRKYCRGIRKEHLMTHPATRDSASGRAVDVDTAPWPDRPGRARFAYRRSASGWRSPTRGCCATAGYAASVATGSVSCGPAANPAAPRCANWWTSGGT